MTINDLRLRDLPFVARLGLTCLLAVIGGGLIMSATHMAWHYDNRDERPGLTLDDIKAQYHGLNSTAPILTMMRSGHAEKLSDPARATLIKWLESTRVAEDYDNMDMGDNSPAEIISRSCAECHSRKAPSGPKVARNVPLDHWEDVKKVAFTRKIDRTGDKIIAASLHTHALGLGSLAAVVSLFALCTAWNRRLTGSLIFVATIGLLTDLTCQWFTKFYEPLSLGIVGGGAAFAGGIGLMLILIFAELWRPTVSPR